MSDALSRTPIADATKRLMAESFAAVPDGKRGALVVIADEHGSRALLAAKLGDHWKVAAGGGADWAGPVTGTVAVVGSW